ncbi:hypothetical protein MNBD_GAMMA24-652 [hydrothermal vent metagenome]|uniref:Phosphoglycerate mutase family protein n=1 Tax=hydrothermal vent metagenome TaxID=652676 RepID=A0A3B1BSL4_9ZZZZ
MARLFAAFIRHAAYMQLPDVPSAHQPFSLNDNGAAQAMKAAGLLLQFSSDKGLQILHAVDSSPLLRSWQTARIINQQLTRKGLHQLRIECFDALAERGVGSYVANLTINQIEEVIRQDPRFAMPPANWKSNSRYCLPFPGAESLLSAGERVAGHVTQRMEELRHICTTDTLKLFVGHGAAFRHAAYHLGILSYEDIAKLSMFYAQPLYFEYRGNNHWRHSAGDWKIRSSQEQVTD